MDAHLKFHFLAPEEDLPGPLPSVEAIKLAQGPDILDTRFNHVVRVNGHFAVKFSRNIDPIECENMRFVAESTQIRIPKLYAAFTDVATGITFLVMEYIPGQTLAQCWGSLGADRKELIATQLRHYFDELRSLPAPDHFACIDGSGLRDPIFNPGGDLEPPQGPFETVEAIARAIADVIRRSPRVVPDAEARSNERGNFFHAGLSATLRGHKAVFTHGDVNFGNLILPDDGGCVVVIDWGYSGWYPSCWETCMALYTCRVFQDDRHAWIGKITGDFMREFAWLFMARDVSLGGI